MTRDEVPGRRGTLVLRCNRKHYHSLTASLDQYSNGERVIALEVERGGDSDGELWLSIEDARTLHDWLGANLRALWEEQNDDA